MAKVLIVPSDNDAPSYYRLRLPYSNINSEIKFEFSEYLDESHITSDIDAFLIQRPVHPELPQFIRDLKAEGKIVVVETDDDISNIPANNPWFNQYNNKIKIYEECLRLADYIHCSADELANFSKASVFYNAMDLKKYDVRKKTGKVHWHGSISHRDSLELIKPVINELVASGIKVVLMGNVDWLKKQFKEGESLMLKEWVHIDKYYEYIKDADVFLTPLPDNKFNRAKSELKILEAAAWRIPSVSSSVAPYIRFNKLSEGGNLLVKKERPREWTKAIMSLLEDDEVYKECSEKSYNAVKETYNLEVVNNQRADWWSKILR